MRFLPISVFVLIISAAPALAQSVSGLPGDFSGLVEQTAPAVLSVSEVGEREEEADRESRSAATGFVVGRSGLIATHASVVAGAEAVKITASDGTSFEASVLGVDEQTGIALVWAREARGLPMLGWGNSGALSTGKWVVALGRPRPDTPTVSVGVVSAPPGDFVQAEVTIGSGNVGGPLLSTAGKVVGFNTVLPNSSGASDGTVVALDQMRTVLEGLATEAAEAERKPARLGVSVQEVDEALARAFGIEPGTGVLVAGVEQNSPAEQAGIRPGDVIVSSGGETIESPKQFREVVENVPAGQQLSISLRRGEEEQSISVQLGPEEQVPSEREEAAEETEPPLRLGVRVVNLAPEIAEQLGIEEVEEGVLVVAVKPGGPADEAGIKPGDVIVSVEGEPITTAEALIQELQAAPRDKTTALRVYRDGSYRFLGVQT